MNMYRKIFEAFNNAGLRYLIVGGVAVNLHGYKRHTADIDILLALDDENLKKLDGLMKSLGYIARLPVSVKDLGDKKKVEQWIREKNLKAYTFLSNTNTDLKLDIDIIVEESLDFSLWDKKKKTLKAWDLDLPVVAIDDLIEMKQRAGRQKDLDDLEALLHLKDF